MITESHIMYIDEPSISQAIRVHFAEFCIVDEKYLENIYRCFLNIKICSLLWEFADCATISYSCGSSIKVKEDFAWIDLSLSNCSWVSYTKNYLITFMMLEYNDLLKSKTFKQVTPSHNSRRSIKNLVPLPEGQHTKATQVIKMIW